MAERGYGLKKESVRQDRWQPVRAAEWYNPPCHAASAD